MKTNIGLVQWCRDHIGVPYVYGMKMAVLTRALYDQLQRQYGTGLVWPSDAQKIGKVCCDCSGLIASYTGVQRSSQQYHDAAKLVNPISTINAAPVGSLVWKSGHIGVYVGMEGGKPTYIAEDGSAFGCRKGLLPGVFTHWFLCPDASYEEVELVTQTDFDKMMDDYLKRQAAKPVNAALAPEFATAKAKGITDGSNPEAFATRAQVAAMVLRATK